MASQFRQTASLIENVGSSSVAPSSSSNLGKSTASRKNPSDLPSFTFIDQDSDLTSKRIKDANARKAIRSHVMRDVRRRERLAGFKRASRPKRDGDAAAAASKPKRKRRTSVSSQQLPLRTARLAKSGSKLTAPATVPTSSSSGTMMVMRLSDSPAPAPTPNPWQSFGSPTQDPFRTLPSAREFPLLTDQLVQYYVNVFLPMTFPSETKLIRQGKWKFSMPGVTEPVADMATFYSIMTMAAAHRAALTAKHVDLSLQADQVIHDKDYYIMKTRCIRLINDKLRDRNEALSAAAFDSIIILAGSCSCLGLFDEARIHIRGLQKMMDMAGAKEKMRFMDAFTSMITVDLKVAAGLLARPLFDIPWQIEGLSLETSQRIEPPPSSILFDMADAFQDASRFSLRLRWCAQRLREAVLLRHAEVSEPYDPPLIYKLMHEIEHELLSYPSEARIPPLEAVARVACLCYSGQSFVVVLPSSGFGRALTKHIKRAISEVPLELSTSLATADLDLLAWALLVAAYGSREQPEYPWFISRLADIIAIQGWTQWEEHCVPVIRRYFYTPQNHSYAWKKIWDDAISHVVVEDVTYA